MKKGKPDPEIYYKVAADMDLRTEDVLIFEDSPVGAESARRAGSQLVVVTTTHQREEFAHLPNVLAFIDDFTTLDIEALRSSERWGV